MKIDKTIISGIIEVVLSLFVKKNLNIPSTSVSNDKVDSSQKISIELQDIDWNNPKSKISKYFTVEEAIRLREWNRLANESDGLNDKVKYNLYNIFQKMDMIRDFLNCPIYIRSAYRPSAYNVSIGGAKFSAHIANEDFAAVDFWCDIDGDGDKDGNDCDLIKDKLMSVLTVWGLRMENNGKGARWVHVDNRNPGPGGRFFKP